MKVKCIDAAPHDIPNEDGIKALEVGRVYEAKPCIWRGKNYFIVNNGVVPLGSICYSASRFEKIDQCKPVSHMLVASSLCLASLP